MSNQEVKRWLSRYINTQREIKALRSNLYSIRETEDGLKAQALTGMPGGSGNKDRMAETVERIQRIERKLSEKILSLGFDLKEISDVIDRVEDQRHRELLRYRYIDGMKWEEICFVMHYSWQHLHRIHAGALQDVYEIMR